MLILANACPMSFHNICQSNFWNIQCKDHICTLNFNSVFLQMISSNNANFFNETANFFNVPSNDYNMHTYVWLVFALNIIFKLVWENLPCIMLPPLSDTHSQQCLTECNIQLLFYHYNKIPSPFFVPPDKNQQSAIISAKPIHSSHFF